MDYASNEEVCDHVVHVELEIDDENESRQVLAIWLVAGIFYSDN